MATTDEVIDEEEVVRMDVDELRGSTRDIDVDPDDLVDAFPSFEHHMTVKAKLRELGRRGAIDAGQVEELEARWREQE